MESAIHNFHEVFSQLGLPNQPQDIEKYISAHRPLAPDIRLFEADFWTTAQSDFLREAFERDADWSGLVDQLNILLRDAAGDQRFVTML